MKNRFFLTILTLTVIFFPVRTVSCSDKAELLGPEQPLFYLYDPGNGPIVHYEEYGTFRNVGTYDYEYTITEKRGLAKVSGEGVDPNTSVEKDPAYKAFKKTRQARDDRWGHIGTDDPKADFFIWATAYEENPGVRLLFTGQALEAAGLNSNALKAYRAAMVLYPRSFGWNRNLTATWLTAPAAWSHIINLTRMHPELGIRLDGSYIETKPCINGDPKNNKVAVTPGEFVAFTQEDIEKARTDVSGLKVVERRGGKVSVVRYENGQWGMQVDGKPFFVQGITYSPTKVGKDYDWNWMVKDDNGNGLIDTAYDTWVDTNGNNRQDPDEPVVGDFALLKDMGCNTIRLFNTLSFNKELLRDLHKSYGIRVMVSEPLGAYTVHSSADWGTGTDYTDPVQKKRMKKAVYAMVMELRDEEWLLGYILGNENNLPSDYTGVNATRTRADTQPEAYASFLNEIAALIHSLDPEHPVGVGNLGLHLVDHYAKYAPELDFIGVNNYAGVNGFGSLWIRAKHIIDRPVMITEFGCDAFWTGKGEDQDTQALYHKNSWNDIVYNAAGGPGEGVSLGGIAFEWLDEWWKDTRGDSKRGQCRSATIEMSFPDGWSQEEWLGIVSQGKGRNSPFLRAPRKAYYMYKDMRASERTDPSYK